MSWLVLRRGALPAVRPPLSLSRCHSRACTTAAPAAASAAPQQSAEWLRARPFEQMPGPRPLPLVGNLWRFLPPLGEFSKLDLAETLVAMRERYGDIVRVVGVPTRSPVVYAFNPDDIQKVFRHEGPWPVRGSAPSMAYYRAVTRRQWFQGAVGVIFSEGEEWLEARRQVNRPMMRPRSAKLYVQPIDRVAREFVDRMLDLKDENGKMPSDFKNELNKWSLESICVVALDARLGCLERNLPADSEPQRMIDATLQVFDCMLELDMRPSPWRYVTTPTWRRLVKALDCLYQISMRHISRAMERIKARGEQRASAGELSVLDSLLVASGDPRVAIVMALDMLFAGIDTTASAVSTTLYFLAKNPEAQQKLYQELCARHPDPTAPLTADVLESCRFLRACVKEALRLRPVSVFNMRSVMVDDLVLSNFRVPRGVDVVASHFVITNSEQHFPHASRFVPERWVKDSAGDYPARTAHPFAYLPFGFGPRMCVGKRFAEFEIHVLLARIQDNNNQTKWGLSEMPKGVDAVGKKVMAWKKASIQFNVPETTRIRPSTIKHSTREEAEKRRRPTVMIRRFHVEFEGEASWKTTMMHMMASPLTFKVTERRPSNELGVRA